MRPRARSTSGGMADRARARGWFYASSCDSAAVTSNENVPDAAATARNGVTMRPPIRLSDVSLAGAPGSRGCGIMRIDLPGKSRARTRNPGEAAAFLSARAAISRESSRGAFPLPPHRVTRRASPWNERKFPRNEGSQLPSDDESTKIDEDAQ